jgi:ribosomal protein S18 acetylase RimI-like enzyme
MLTKLPPHCKPDSVRSVLVCLGPSRGCYSHSMHLRQATQDDIPAIMQIIARVVPPMRAAGNLQWDDTYPNHEAFAADIQQSELWIAALAGNVLGVAAITTDQSPEYVQVGWDITQPAIVVHRLAVDPEARGQGIAAALMQQAEAVAVGSGIAILRVDTSTRNEATQRLFPKLGYTLCGEISLSFRSGLRVLCYEKRLPRIEARG